MRKLILTGILVLSGLFGITTQAVAEVGVSVVFSDDEIRIIGAWYSEHGSNSKQGNGKQKTRACHRVSRRTSSAASPCLRESPSNTCLTD